MITAVNITSSSQSASKIKWWDTYIDPETHKSFKGRSNLYSLHDTQKHWSGHLKLIKTHRDIKVSYKSYSSIFCKDFNTDVKLTRTHFTDHSHRKILKI